MGYPCYDGSIQRVERVGMTPDTVAAAWAGIVIFICVVVIIVSTIWGRRRGR